MALGIVWKFYATLFWWLTEILIELLWEKFLTLDAFLRLWKDLLVQSFSSWQLCLQFL